MTTVSPIGDAGIFRAPPQASANDELGQADFLTLMITQFKNQDPFEPMDNGEFLGQLAQFSTVNGIDSLNSSFAGLANSISGEQALQAANLVGHSVLAVTDVGYLAEDESVNGLIELESSASAVQIDILDESGELLQTLDLGEQQAGLVRFSWDGRNAAGEIVDPGHYQFKARVVRGTQVESAATAIQADIESVTLGQFGGDMLLNLTGGGALSLGQVYQII
ncbi:MAG: flagellar hook assembly protein FlgD [Woeseiaceae bacterium]